MIKFTAIVALALCSITTQSQTLNLDSMALAMKVKQGSMLGTHFEYPGLITITGKQISSADLKGKVVMYNYWFSSCPPCIVELPALNELKTKYPDVVFIGMTFESEDDIRKFTTKYPFNFDLVSMSRKKLEEKVNFGYPTTIVVNKKGEIIFIETGGAIKEEKAFELIRQRVEPKLISALLEKG
jgi:cytochrome c biogenesis protein CcmG, thiol:disulfide interchange protein DsbE